jgi:hypothetical protein
MVSVITIASLLCLALAAAVLFVWRRRIGFSGLDNISVSRQWLIQHQADDRS